MFTWMTEHNPLKIKGLNQKPERWLSMGKINRHCKHQTWNIYTQFFQDIQSVKYSTARIYINQKTHRKCQKIACECD